MLKSFVLKTIQENNLIQYGDKVIVGLSGGPDSVCLLHLLYSLKSELNISIYAVHINHMLRGQESKKDEEYVYELCSKLGISLSVKAYNIKQISEEKSISLEEAGREIRYHEFSTFADKLQAQCIAVAHNKNDQSETVLMHLIRGAGLDGLKGMDFKRGRIIRPILNIDRRKIEEYCSQNDLKPRVDSSNLENVYTRNKLRNQLIPEIDSQFGTNMTDSLYRMSLILKEDNNFLEEYSESLYNKCIAKKENNSVWLDLAKLKTLHRAIIKRIIRNAIMEVSNSLKGIESNHVDKVMYAVFHGRTGAIVQLPRKLRAVRTYNEIGLVIQQEKNIKTQNKLFDIELKLPGISKIEELNADVDAAIVTDFIKVEQYFNIKSSSPVQYFDYDLLFGGIRLRNRREGDLFKPYKSNGTKKLKEYFIDTKIPKERRGNIPIITKNKDVVWIIGYKISDKFKVTENTKSILKLEYKKHF